MGMCSFDVGEKETHTVSLHISKVFGTHRLEVDGNPVHKKFNWVVGTKDMMIDVGKKEKHRVRISLRIPVLPAFRAWEATVFIDGKLYYTYKL